MTTFQKAFTFFEKDKKTFENKQQVLESMDKSNDTTMIAAGIPALLSLFCAMFGAAGLLAFLHFMLGCRISFDPPKCREGIENHIWIGWGVTKERLPYVQAASGIIGFTSIVFAILLCSFSGLILGCRKKQESARINAIVHPELPFVHSQYKTLEGWLEANNNEVSKNKSLDDLITELRKEGLSFEEKGTVIRLLETLKEKMSAKEEKAPLISIK